MTRAGVLALLRLMIFSPREGMRRCLELRFQGVELLYLAVFVVVLTGLSGFFVGAFMPENPETTPMRPSGFMIIAASNMVLSTFVFFWAGKAMEGTGTLSDVAFALILHQLFMIGFQIFIAVIAVISPQLGGIAFVVGFGYAIYILAAYLAAAHHFDTIGRAFLLIVGVAFLLVVLFFVLLSLFGSSLP